MGNSAVSIAGRSFSVSNMDKVLWPEDGYTKGELIHYYLEAAPYLLPHLRERAMVFTRYPNGILGQHFYQKNAPVSLPEWIDTFPYYSTESKREINFILVDENATLAWLANQACIEMHPWLSCVDREDYPDFMVIDLDPSPGNSFEEVRRIALVTGKVLEELGLRGYVKTSGSEGLHIYVPIVNDYTYANVRDFAQAIAGMVCNVLPDIATIERAVKKRGRKVYVDYLQNVKGKTLCSVYSVRPRHGATVSAPIYWDEINQVYPGDFSIKTIIPRLKKEGDLFAPVLTDRQSLEKAAGQLGVKLGVVNSV